MTQTVDKLLSRTGDTALRRRARWMLGKIKNKKTFRILDVGCGDGFYLYLFKSLFPNAKITGVDMDKKALVSAFKNVKGKNVSLKYGDVCDLKFKDNSFDVVLASEVLEHLDDDKKGLSNIYRVLKPGGLILASVPNKNYPLFWDPVNWVLEKVVKYHIKNGFWAGIWNQHNRLYSQQELINLLRKENFKEIDSAVLTYYCLPFNHYLLNIFARILSKQKKFLSKSPINKFTGGKNKKSFNPFWFLFLFDKLNDKFKSSNIGVSVAASAVKS